jgi:hypothetical protein
MNKKYERYINYIVNDIEAPYFIKMRDSYGLSPNEYSLILLNIFNEPVTITGNDVYDVNGNKIYYENSNGSWVKREYDNNGNNIYYEDSSGYWVKYEYDTNGKVIYYETSDGVIIDYRR